ncbi:MAG: bifunctional non-ous end joining protein LigD [Solirubrobacteraceae bacterium]|nr:bifunctional non-ous end joining protein LigD [Solirubrobacteraceae bacterium]
MAQPRRGSRVAAMPRTAPSREPLPRFLEPMLLRPGLPPAGARQQWALELKWDGMRAQLRLARDGAWCLRSRPGRACSDQFPELASLAAAIPSRDVLLDGELVCLGADGRPDFAALRRRLSAADARSADRLAAAHPATLIVFDLLHLDGRATRTLHYARRRTLLEQELPTHGPSWRVPSPLTGELDAVLAVTRAHQLEGVVAKRLDAPYEPGRRSGAWRKHKHRRHETFAVTGWRPAAPNARRPDAVFVARTTADGTLVPVGSAELGLSGEERERLRVALERRRTATRRGAHRVGTGIWVDVDFHGRDDGPLRDAVMRTVHFNG